MRSLLAAALLCAAPAAAADPAATVHVDSVFGMDGEAPALDGLDDALAKCTDTPTGSAVFLVEVNKDGRVAAAYAHGAEKLDACVQKALRAGKVTAKLPNAIALLGRIDLGSQPTPRISQAAMVIAAHDAAWQVTVDRVAYTANRTLDIGAELDGASVAIAACAAKRGNKAVAVHGIAWTDGHPLVRTGTPAYDTCLEHALAAIKLPREDSAMWLELSIAPPAEPLAPRSTAKHPK